MASRSDEYMKRMSEGLDLAADVVEGQAKPASMALTLAGVAIGVIASGLCAIAEAIKETKQ